MNLHGYPIVNNSSDLIYLLENSQLDGCIFRKLYNSKIKSLMKKIVFLISRSNDLRFYGPIIDYFNLKKKLYIEFWYYETDLKNYNFKKYLNPLNLNTSLKKNIKIIDLKNTKNLKDYILKNHENISYFFL